jgi:hypothetical protein
VLVVGVARARRLSRRLPRRRLTLLSPAPSPPQEPAEQFDLAELERRLYELGAEDDAAAGYGAADAAPAPETFAFGNLGAPAHVLAPPVAAPGYGFGLVPAGVPLPAAPATAAPALAGRPLFADAAPAAAAAAADVVAAGRGADEEVPVIEIRDESDVAARFLP